MDAVPGRRKRRKRSHANGDGSVTVCKGRKKPFKAVVSVGAREREDGEFYYARKVLGYFQTRGEAEDALSDYRRNPYDLDAKRLTFADVYQKWSEQHFEKISTSKARQYISAYKNAPSLHPMLFTDIRPAHIEAAMRQANVGSATKNTIKQLCGLLYKWGMKNEICSTNYAAMCDGVKQDAPTLIRLPFTEEEEKLLWDNLDFPYVDMVLIGMYSGWRPQELATLKTADVSLADKVMYGGIKTDAGKNRAVPIHSKIYPLVEKRVEAAAGSPSLFTDESGRGLAYNTYKKRFDKIKGSMGWSHSPHDVRHTFVTKGKEAGMDEYILKLIVGHAVRDITEKIYTHRKIDELRREIEKIK